MGGTKIPNYKQMSLKTKLNSYNKPKLVYIPLVLNANDDVTILVKKDDYVFKGSMIAKRKTSFKTPVFSSVSGKIIGFEEHTIFNGNKVKCAVIENDFKERIEKGFKIVSELNKLTKKDFIEKLERCGIVGLGGAGFPTYIKYNTDKKIKLLIINASECEPYITADYFIIKEKSEEILEMIDAILEINNIDKAIIAISASNKSLINTLNKYIGTYLKIKIALVPDLYSIGWERSLIYKLTGISYDKLPIEKGIIVNNVSTIYAMYQAIKLNKPIIERIITFSGNGLKKPQNVLVKVGTPVKEVVEYIGGCYKSKSIIMIAGGPMMGRSVDELVVTPELNCVLFLEDSEESEITECIRCGKCISVCPAKICPVLIKENIDNKEKLEEMDVLKCVDCGLCSYVCPAKINVREYIRKAKSEVRK